MQIPQYKNPSWSPNGKKVAFLSNQTGIRQLYAGSKQLTRGKDSVSYAEFSPCKNEIIFLVDKQGNQCDQIFLYNLNKGVSHPLINNPKIVHHFGGWSKDGSRVAFSSNKRNGRDFDVYIFNLRTKKTKLIFKRGGWGDSYGFSPDGKYVLVRVRHSSEKHDLYLVGEKTVCLGKGTKFAKPQWLTDSSGFFIITDQGREFLGVAFCNLKTLKYKTTPQWDVEDIALNPRSGKLTTVVNKHGYSFVSPGIGLPKGVVRDLHWNVQGRKMVMTFSNSKYPSSIFVNNKPLLSAKKHALIEPRLKKYKSFDGLSIPVFVYAKKSKKPQPAVVFMHGGPAAQLRPDFRVVAQALACAGYTVLAPNVRGSSGYGKRYLALDDKGKRFDTVKDLEFLYKWLSRQTNIDKNRVALMGRSYGGYMVLAGLAFLPKLWAAGVCIAGIADFAAYLKNTASWRRALREAEYGSEPKLLKKLSPIHRVKDIRAPLLLIHGVNDPRVPISEAKAIADKLGKMAKLIAYADEGHIFQKRKNELDCFSKAFAFLKKHL